MIILRCKNIDGENEESYIVVLKNEIKNRI